VIALALALTVAAAPGGGDAESVALQQTTRPAPVRTTVVDNATVTVTRLRFAPGSGETVHTHDFPIVIVQLTSGDVVDLTVSDARARGPRVAGLVTFVPAGTEHAVVNAGTMPFEMMAVAIKPSRTSAPAAPPTDAPPGITRTTLLDNDDVRVVRVEFTPGSQEPVHTHPNDLVTIQMNAGRLQIRLGTRRTDSRRPVGFVQFVPRTQRHAYSSRNDRSIELLSVSIK
jgi:quercetin dioxygenase-like cupin family protein